VLDGLEDERPEARHDLRRGGQDAADRAPAHPRDQGHLDLAGQDRLEAFAEPALDPQRLEQAERLAARAGLVLGRDNPVAGGGEPGGELAVAGADVGSRAAAGNQLGDRLEPP
jgi:hypothetical protein